MIDKTKEAIQQAYSTGIFRYKKELKEVDNKTKFTILDSIEFWQIIYLKDSELYYLSYEEQSLLNSYSDEIHKTDKGVIYCYK